MYKKRTCRKKNSTNVRKSIVQPKPKVYNHGVVVVKLQMKCKYRRGVITNFANSM